MRKLVKAGLTHAIVLSGLLLTHVAYAQDKTLKDGVFTDAQATAGQLVFDNSCKTCHNLRFYRDTMKSWDSQPLQFLYDTIIGTMPADNPGSLGLDEYTNVVAYILSELKFPAGEQALDHTAGMEHITIISP